MISREQGGVGSLIDVDQARTLVASAQSSLALLERRRSRRRILSASSPDDRQGRSRAGP